MGSVDSSAPGMRERQRQMLGASNSRGMGPGSTQALPGNNQDCPCSLGLLRALLVGEAEALLDLPFSCVAERPVYSQDTCLCLGALPKHQGQDMYL